jgi:hypothetical protein
MRGDSGWRIPQCDFCAGNMMDVLRWQSQQKADRGSVGIKKSCGYAGKSFENDKETKK